MKRAIFAIALLGTTAMSAHAAEVIWQGDVFVKTVQGTCAASGINVGSFLRGVFKPRNVGDNGVDTKLSLIGQRNAHRYLFAASAYGNKTGVASTVITSTANSFDDTHNFTAATAVNAAGGAITATTQTIVLKGKITDFSGITGCTASILGSLGLRID